MPISIAAAQIPSFRGDLAANIEVHLLAALQAAELNVDFLQFPELSLTGRDLQAASRHAFCVDDPRLDPLQRMAELKQMTLAVGLPLKTGWKPRIGMIVFTPEGFRLAYSCMFRSSGQNRAFGLGKKHLTCISGLGADQISIGMATGADICRERHARSCKRSGAELYSSGVLLAPGQFDAAARKMRAYSADYGMVALMANCRSGSSRIASQSNNAGGSAVWSPDGLLAAADHRSDALVIATRTASVWKGETVLLSFPRIPQWGDSVVNPFGSFFV